MGQGPAGFNKQLAKYIKLLSALTRVLVDPLRSIPFGRNMELVHLPTVLPVRRAIAAHLSEQAVHALMSRPDPRRPNFGLMQELYECGLRQCPLSGMPIFDPSKLDEGEQRVLWRMYCALPLAINNAAEASEALTAIDGVRKMLEERRTAAAAAAAPENDDE